MKNLVSQIVFILAFFTNNLSYGQVDTVAAQRFQDSIYTDAISQAYWENLTDNPIDTLAIINEINALTNDSLIKAYWIRLNSCDQDLHTFEHPAQQAINLLKCCYFFRKFGFSLYSPFTPKKMAFDDAEMYAGIIWGHCAFIDLKYLSIPLRKECSKTHDDYIIEDSIFARILSPFNYSTKNSINRVSELSFDKINSPAFVALVNEFKKLSYQFKSIYIEQIPKKNIIGEWRETDKTNEKIITKWIIIKNKGNYYLREYGTGIYKLIKKNNSTFHFFTNIDDTYLEILANGNLAIKDADGRIIVTYLK